MDNILIIGGNGFLGNHITKNIKNKGLFNVYVFDRVSNSDKSIKTFIGDVKDITLLKQIIAKQKINIIIYLVSTLIPSSSFSEYSKDLEIVYAPLNELLMYASENNIKFVFFSSGGTVYGSQSGKLKETDKTNPISFYGLSKVQIENLILFYNKQYNLKYLIIRPSNPYGYGQNINGRQGLIAVGLGKILNNQTIDIYGDGENIRDYIFIDDFCYYINELLKLDINNKILNIGSGIGYSINQVLSIIETITNKHFNINRKEARAVDVKSIIMNIEELEKIVPYKQQTLQAGISDFYKKLKML